MSAEARARIAEAARERWASGAWLIRLTRSSLNQVGNNSAHAVICAGQGKGGEGRRWQSLRRSGFSGDRGGSVCHPKSSTACVRFEENADGLRGLAPVIGTLNPMHLVTRSAAGP